SAPSSPGVRRPPPSGTPGSGTGPDEPAGPLWRNWDPPICNSFSRPEPIIQAAQQRRANLSAGIHRHMFGFDAIPAARLRGWSQGAGIAVVTIGCLVLLGWLTNVPLLQSTFPGTLVMK